MLVWQDMPAMANTPNAAAQSQWLTEFHSMVTQHVSSPSVVMWVDQNEGWGAFDPAGVATTVKGWDPSRLVDNMSGINCCGSPDGGNGDVADYHTYPGPDSAPAGGQRANVLGEYGGLALIVPGHEYTPNGFGHEEQPDGTALTNRFVGMTKSLIDLMANRGLNAAVYTQPTDVEREANGFMTYDRQVVKVDSAAVRAANQGLVAASQRVGGVRVALPVNGTISIRAASAGSTDRYIRHQGGVGVASVITTGSSDLDKQDATFTVRPGLENGSCVSFESYNYPGSYLRQLNGRVSRAASDGTSVFAGDATFCPVVGNSGSGVSFASWSQNGKFLRLYNGGVWVSTDGGGKSQAAQDTASNWMADTTWNVAAPWAAGVATAPAVATGAVKSGMAGKCLDVRGGSGASGTPVQSYDCNGSAGQQWTSYTDGSLRILGKCLDATGAGTTNGTLVALWDCHGGSNQQWQPYNAAYRNPISGRCLDIPGGSSANGIQVALWDCNYGIHQVWSTPGFVATATRSGPIRSGMGSYCLDVAGGNSANGTPVVLWGCSGGSNQTWTAYTDNSLRALGKCLQTVGGGTVSGTELEISDCGGAQSQRWLPTSSGGYLNPVSGRCIDSPAGSTANGTRPALFDCWTDAANQRWTQPGA
jgi:hypothetical protein